MCIAVFLWQAHPLYPFLLLQNRDEYHNSGMVGRLQDIGGRDEVAGGTWLACPRGGRLAFLTSVLELHTDPDTDPEAKSREDLPVLFLESSFSNNQWPSTKTPKEFAQELAKEAHRDNGFNLVLADIPSQTRFPSPTGQKEKRFLFKRFLQACGRNTL